MCRSVHPLALWSSSGVGSPWAAATGRAAPPPKAARAAGWQVGCTPYRVETLRPHTEQRCRWWSRNHCGGTWPCRVPARWESTWEIKVCLMVHPWAPRHRAIQRVSGRGVVGWPVHLRAGCLVQEGPGWRLRQPDIPERAHAIEVCGVDVAPKSGAAGGKGSGGADEGQPGRCGNSSCPSKDIGWDEAANRCQVEGPSES